MPPKKFIGTFDNALIEDISEFYKRYQNTLLFYKKQPVNCLGAEGSAVMFEGEEIGIILLNSQTEEDLELIWPQYGWYNADNRAMFCSRIPARQWKRAPCDANTQLEDPVKGQLFPSSNNPLLSFSRLKNVTTLYNEKNHEPVKMEEALKRLNTYAYSVALCDDFAISLSPKKEEKGSRSQKILWYKTFPIAEVDQGAHRIHVKYPYLRQEVMDYVRDKESGLWQVT